MYEVTWERNVMVPMPDGVRLATDIYLPRGVPGPWPAIYESTPYDKKGTAGVLTAKLFASQGYAVILQDVRGRFASEGEWYPFGQEGPDQAETVAWARRQPWCDGRVATIGLSYSSCTQTALAALNPPGLAGQFVAHGFHNYHTNSMRQGGAMELRFFLYAFHMALTSHEAMADPVARAALEKVNVRDWLRYLPPKEGLTPLRFVPSYERWVLGVLRHGEYDSYWTSRPGYSIEHLWDNHADVPIYLLGSWYDSYARSTVANYEELKKRKKGPVRLIMGPWIHGGANVDLPYSGDAEFGPDAPLGYDAYRLRWFNAVLKGEKNGILEEPPVKIFVMGGGSGRKTFAYRSHGKLDVGGFWRQENEWPLRRTEYMPFYLQPGGGLSPAKPPEQASASRFKFEPKDPVPTIGGQISVGYDIMPGGGFDQKKDGISLSARRDVLVFSTPPLEKDIEVTGPLVMKLWAASTAPDTDFTAKLIDVYPPNADYPEGYELNIADSIIRARYRDSREEPRLMQPGTVYEFTITMYPTSLIFQKGHRIRVHISSSNFPRFDVNPNTGGPLGLEQVMDTATQTIFHDAARPSHILLPVIPS